MLIKLTNNKAIQRTAQEDNRPTSIKLLVYDEVIIFGILQGFLPVFSVVV